MRRSPSIIPDVADRDIYLVLDDFRRLGRSWRETDDQSTDRTAIIQDPLEGQYNMPVTVIAFNTAEGWSRDVSEEIADALRLACAKDGDVPTTLEDFIAGIARQRRSSCHCRFAWSANGVREVVARYRSRQKVIRYREKHIVVL